MDKSLSISLDTQIDFRKEYPDLIAEDNSLSFVSNDNGESYNLCHCMSVVFFIVKSSIHISPYSEKSGQILK